MTGRIAATSTGVGMAILVVALGGILAWLVEETYPLPVKALFAFAGFCIGYMVARDG